MGNNKVVVLIRGTEGKDKRDGGSSGGMREHRGRT